MPARARAALLRGLAGAMPFPLRRVRSLLEILAIAEPHSRYASWSGAFGSRLAPRLLSRALREAAGDGGLARAFLQVLEGCDSDDPVDRFAYCDLHTRLVDDILVKGDRMSMAAGIEARVPFLDHKVVEFAARLPSRLRVDGLATKVLLKDVAARHLPQDLVYRRKVGFTVPLTRWFTGA